MDIFSFQESRRYSCYRYAFFIYLLTFVGGFYFTLLPSSRHSALIRGGLLIILLIFCAEYITQRRLGVAYLTGKMSVWHENIALPGKLLFASLTSLFVYFIVQSALYEDFDSVRRVAVVWFFLIFVAFSMLNLRFDIRWLIYPVAVLGVFFSFVYGLRFFSKENMVFANPLRDATSGLSWFGSYENTIIAALFWSVLLLALAWAYAESKARLILLLYYVASCVALLAIYHTAARTAWVASMCGICGLFVFSNYHKKRKLLYFVIPAILIATAYMFFQPEAILRQGLTYRDNIWIEHLTRLEGYGDWVFGKGLGALEAFVKLPGGSLAIHSHSIYVETLYAGGLTAVTLLLIVLGLTAYCLFDKEIKFRGKGFVGALLAGGSLAMIFDFNGLFGTPNLVWLWLWLPMAVLLAGALGAYAEPCVNENLSR